MKKENNKEVLHFYQPTALRDSYRPLKEGYQPKKNLQGNPPTPPNIKPIINPPDTKK